MIVGHFGTKWFAVIYVGALREEIME